MHYAVVRRHTNYGCKQKWQRRRQNAKGSPPRTPNLRFGRFLQLGGSKWTEIMLYEQGVPLRLSGHLTCLYSAEEKFDLKWGDKTEGIGAK